MVHVCEILAEWPGSFMCCCGNTEKKIEKKILPLPLWGLKPATFQLQGLQLLPLSYPCCLYSISDTHW